MIKKAILIGLGIVLLAIGGKSLLLVTIGDTTQGVIEKAQQKSVTTQMTGGRRSVHKATGYYYIKTAVVYKFDIEPTPLEELQRLSEAPIAEDVRGSDVIVQLSRDTSGTLAKGSLLQIIFIRNYPTINAVYQPDRLKTYGSLYFAGGLFLLIWGIKIRTGSTVEISPGLIEKE